MDLLDRLQTAGYPRGSHESEQMGALLSGLFKSGISVGYFHQPHERGTRGRRRGGSTRNVGEASTRLVVERWAKRSSRLAVVMDTSSHHERVGRRRTHEAGPRRPHLRDRARAGRSLPHYRGGARSSNPSPHGTVQDKHEHGGLECGSDRRLTHS